MTTQQQDALLELSKQACSYMVAVKRGLSRETQELFERKAERAVWLAFRVGCTDDDVVAAQMSGVEAA